MAKKNIDESQKIFELSDEILLRYNERIVQLLSNISKKIYDSKQRAIELKYKKWKIIISSGVAQFRGKNVQGYPKQSLLYLKFNHQLTSPDSEDRKITMKLIHITNIKGTSLVILSFLKSHYEIETQNDLIKFVDLLSGALLSAL